MTRDDLVLIRVRKGALLVIPSQGRYAYLSPSETTQVSDGLCVDENLDAAALERFGQPLSDAVAPATQPTPRISLQLTNACNLGCTFCHCGSGRPRSREMTFAQLDELWDAAKANPCLYPGL